MKKTLVIALTFGLLIACGVQKSQKQIKPTSNYSLADLKNIAKWKFGFDLEKEEFCDFYILDGIPFDQNQIDSVLAQYDKTQIGLITVIDMSKNEVFLHRKCDLITIIDSKPQSNSNKRKILKEVTEVYNDRVLEIIISDYQCADCPLLSVNGDLIWNPYERKRIINQLSVSNIEYISYISQSLNMKNFGLRGKNGIVEITTE